MTQIRRMPAGATVQYHLGDGFMREGIVLKTVPGIGFSILPDSGRRLLVPAINVKGVPARR